MDSERDRLHTGAVADPTTAPAHYAHSDRNPFGPGEQIPIADGCQLRRWRRALHQAEDTAGWVTRDRDRADGRHVHRPHAYLTAEPVDLGERFLHRVLRDLVVDRPGAHRHAVRSLENARAVIAFAVTLQHRVGPGADIHDAFGEPGDRGVKRRRTFHISRRQLVPSDAALWRRKGGWLRILRWHRFEGGKNGALRIRSDSHAPDPFDIERRLDYRAPELGDLGAARVNALRQVEVRQPVGRHPRARIEWIDPAEAVGVALPIHEHVVGVVAHRHRIDLPTEELCVERRRLLRIGRHQIVPDESRRHSAPAPLARSALDRVYVHLVTRIAQTFEKSRGIDSD